jgi:MinD-like ATPase involved in chromosome partitioning or flagellar assembly
MLICLGSVKGSPGVTTFAVALALRWPIPGPAPLVVELDPAGGDLGARWQTREQPGLAGMVLAARRAALGDGAPWTQRLAIPTGGKQAGWPQVHAIVAPPADGAAAALSEFATAGAAGQAAALVGLAKARTVLADLGRLDPQSPQLALAAAADLMLLVARPTLDQIRHVAARLPALRAHNGSIMLLLVGPGPYPPAEIANYLGVPVLGNIPTDPVSASVLAGAGRATSGWSRRPLLSAARTVALVCANRVSKAHRHEPARTAETAEVGS